MSCLVGGKARVPPTAGLRPYRHSGTEDWQLVELGLLVHVGLFDALLIGRFPRPFLWFRRIARGVPGTTAISLLASAIRRAYS